MRSATITPFFFSGDRDESRSESFSFIFRGDYGRRQNVHVRLSAQYFERECCSYELRAEVYLYGKDMTRIPVMISIGFMSRFPDASYKHHRHRLVFALSNERFLRGLIRNAERYVRAKNLDKFDLFVRVENIVADTEREVGDIHHIRVRAGVGEGFPWTSNKIALADSPDTVVVDESAKDCRQKINSFLAARMLVLRPEMA